MFKLNSKPFNEPVKQSYIAEDDFEQVLEDEDVDVAQSDTFMLAQFLSSTGPEEFSNQNSHISSSNSKKFKKASRILNRLRKQPTMTVLGSRPMMEEPKKHIPLQVNYVSPLDITGSTISTVSALSSSAVSESAAVVPRETVPSSPNSNTKINYNSRTSNNSNNNSDNRNSFYSHHHYYYNKNDNAHTNMHKAESVVSSTMRDSGIYSETMSTLEKPSCMMINDMYFPHPPPSRPEPLPLAIASAAIDAACSSVYLTPKQLRTVPEAALKRKSVRLRHIQIQTESPLIKTKEQHEGDQRSSCPHCRQVITPLSKRQRRVSCPPALSSGPTQDARQLYDIIHSLKLQLDKERKHRQELEKKVDQHHLSDRKESLLKEKSKWEGECLKMNNRMALISE
ncbi:hypothetical protein K501DRAFT_329350 [Backusella circina FSU 941]|nr:hypothetical protein K501DRAFT_329350 [Backusella circina FSU 941]